MTQPADTDFLGGLIPHSRSDSGPVSCRGSTPVSGFLNSVLMVPTSQHELTPTRPGFSPHFWSLLHPFIFSTHPSSSNYQHVLHFVRATLGATFPAAPHRGSHNCISTKMHQPSDSTASSSPAAWLHQPASWRPGSWSHTLLSGSLP